MTQQVIIIGGGFGGIEAAFSLHDIMGPEAAITLIDRGGHHFYLPSIHEIVSGKTTIKEISIPLAVMLAPSGITVVKDEVLSIDPRARMVTGRSNTYSYDYLIIGAGATNNFYDIPGAGEHSHPFRTPEHAERIRDRLEQLLLHEPSCDLVIAGGGSEGVEMAGEVLDAIRARGRGEDLRAGKVTLTIIEGRSSLLPEFPHRAQEFALDYLLRQGAHILTGCRIREVTKDEVLLENGLRRGSSMLIWSGGIQPSDLVRSLDLPKDRDGWLRVNEELRSLGNERVYGIGDAIAILRDGEAVPLPRLAYHAQDQARVASVNISRQIRGEVPVAYAPKKGPQLISMGRESGLLVAGERYLSGPWVAGLKKAIERKHLLTYLSRPATSALWHRMPGAELLKRLRMKIPL